MEGVLAVACLAVSNTTAPYQHRARYLSSRRRLGLGRRHHMRPLESQTQPGTANKPVVCLPASSMVARLRNAQTYRARNEHANSLRRRPTIHTELVCVFVFARSSSLLLDLAKLILSFALAASVYRPRDLSRSLARSQPSESSR